MSNSTLRTPSDVTLYVSLYWFPSQVATCDTPLGTGKTAPLLRPSMNPIRRAALESTVSPGTLVAARYSSAKFPINSAMDF